MKRTIVTGAFVTALIISGGTGAYMAYANGNSPSVKSSMDQPGMNMEQMIKQVKTGDLENMQKLMKQGNASFEQMKTYMKQMHPNLSDQQLKELFNNMHGKAGACNNQKMQGMMGNNL